MPNFYEAHISAISGRKKVTIIKMKPEDIKTHNTATSRRIYSCFMEGLKVPFFIFKGIALGGQIVKHNLTGRVSAATA